MIKVRVNPTKLKANLIVLAILVAVFSIMGILLTVIGNNQATGSDAIHLVN